MELIVNRFIIIFIMPKKLESHSNKFHFVSKYKPDTCCMVCDEKDRTNSAGCCPICHSLYHKFTGGYRPFGGPFGPGLSMNPMKFPNDARPFIEQRGLQHGLDESNALRDPRIVKLGMNDYTIKLREDTKRKNEEIDRKQEMVNEYRESMINYNDEQKAKVSERNTNRIQKATQKFAGVAAAAAKIAAGGAAAGAGIAAADALLKSNNGGGGSSSKKTGKGGSSSSSGGGKKASKSSNSSKSKTKGGSKKKTGSSKKKNGSSSKKSGGSSKKSGGTKKGSSTQTKHARRRPRRPRGIFTI